MWVGYFDRGIDLIATETSERVSHIEDDRVREVNFMAFDPDADRMHAATSRGLVSFDGQLKQSILTRQQGGLINDSIAHVSVANGAASIRGSTDSLSLDRPLVVAMTARIPIRVR